ncbi:pyridoxamine 5'-phosphate oxidase family protein [Leucobacter tardus]|uniref:Pyridoxamine 5'-phosphate oxidase family protein n=1 Tax=Leucobacter tardus TaxID=501483 RepID=A0A939QF13_9MICO|nr:pyridoxamine 5'-phosphate oxidase family protein [Leucobacter tardus]MBO2990706.1 pyridoxamine 5'-phosphate oxidase family protein [Leucobacter tardus]
MGDAQGPVAHLDAAVSWERLRSQHLGRIVTRVGDVVDIFPVNYVVDGESIVFRTAEGGKLAELTINERVLFEVDDYDALEAWSVVVRGTAQRLESDAEVAEVEQLPLRPMVPTLKTNFVRITATEVTGRQFERGPEPNLFEVQPY